MMNIWVEYWPNPVQDTKYYAQSKKVSWQTPDPKDIRRRFCQSREDASTFAKSMQEQGYYVSIKQDGYGQ